MVALLPTRQLLAGSLTIVLTKKFILRSLEVLAQYYWAWVCQKLILGSDTESADTPLMSWQDDS